MTELDYLIKFTDRKSGYIFWSRHEHPDFTYGLSDEQINEKFIVDKITDKEEIKKHVW